MRNITNLLQGNSSNIMKRALILILIIFTIWLSGLMWFVGEIPDSAPEDTSPQAIIVLTGGSLRIEQGLELLESNSNAKMLISGVGKNVTINSITDSNNLETINRITLGYWATNTIENAEETRAWLSFKDYKNILVVTANYHTPRAEQEFKFAMPDINITMYPVFPSDVHIDNWWKYAGSSSLIVSEYHKYIYSKVVTDGLFN